MSSQVFQVVFFTQIMVHDASCQSTHFIPRTRRKKECFDEDEYNEILRTTKDKNNLGHFKDFAMMMLNIPSEFQHWHNMYEFDMNNTSN